jgi:hypothetical protein
MDTHRKTTPGGHGMKTPSTSQGEQPGVAFPHSPQKEAAPGPSILNLQPPEQGELSPTYALPVAWVKEVPAKD